MSRANLIHAPLIALIAFAFRAPMEAPLHGRSPAESSSQPAQVSSTTSGKSVDGRKEIFCSNLKTGQLCPDSTTEILGLKGPQAEAWKAIVRKYNQGAENAARQLQNDSAVKLTPEQMEVLKAWFAVGWNEEINKILYKRNLDDLKKADTTGLSTRKEDEHDDH